MTMSVWVKSGVFLIICILAMCWMVYDLSGARRRRKRERERAEQRRNK